MLRELCMLILLGFVTSFAAWAEDSSGELDEIKLDEAEFESFVEQFDGEFDLEWDIVREESDAYSLETAPGELVVQTLYGSIVKTYGENAKNMFLIREPVDATKPFQMTIFVTQFDPTQAYQQIALLAYQNDSHFLKFSYEHHGSGDGTGLHRCHEVDPDSKFKGRPIEFDGPFWLRMTHQGTSYQLSYSDDGDEFTAVDSVEWPVDDEAGDLRVGFVAKNGTSRAASTAVAIEYFQLLKPRSE